MKKLTQFLHRFGKPPQKTIEAAGDRVFQDVFVRREGSRLTPQMDGEPVRPKTSRLPAFALALAAVLLLMVTPIRDVLWQPKGIQTISVGQTVRATISPSTVFKIADGSLIELRVGSELFLESADDGVRLRLTQGTVIVNAARQRDRHLYVQTKDITVSVVGTVFFVATEEAGSRVGVLEGMVDVKHADKSRTLRAGDQFSTVSPAVTSSLFEAVSWSIYIEQHRELLMPFATPESAKVEREEVAAIAQTVQTAQAPQRGAAPSRSGFEVVSIRRNTNGGPGLLDDGSPGRYRANNIPIRDLIEWAYDIQDFQLIGAPAWLSNEFYDIDATLEDPRRRDDLVPMIQVLLEERFKLKVHGQAQETAVYFLVPAKGGLKLKAGPCTMQDRSAPYDPKRDYSKVCGFFVGGQFDLQGTGIGVKELTDTLSRHVGRRVLDKTGFAGRFDLKLNFKPDDPGFNVPEFANTPTLLVALEEELGLKLESGRAPIDALVIDHIERPSEN
jgi:uncharacterized protein (TIGR03435 family)